MDDESNILRERFGKRIRLKVSQFLSLLLNSSTLTVSTTSLRVGRDWKMREIDCRRREGRGGRGGGGGGKKSYIIFIPLPPLTHYTDEP